MIESGVSSAFEGNNAVGEYGVAGIHEKGNYVAVGKTFFNKTNTHDYTYLKKVWEIGNPK